MRPVARHPLERPPTEHERGRRVEQLDRVVEPLAVGAHPVDALASFAESVEDAIERHHHREDDPAHAATANWPAAVSSHALWASRTRVHNLSTVWDGTVSRIPNMSPRASSQSAR